jgi:hypothetical protein
MMEYSSKQIVEHSSKQDRKMQQQKRWGNTAADKMLGQVMDYDLQAEQVQACKQSNRMCVRKKGTECTL